MLDGHANGFILKLIGNAADQHIVKAIVQMAVGSPSNNFKNIVHRESNRGRLRLLDRIIETPRCGGACANSASRTAGNMSEFCA